MSNITLKTKKRKRSTKTSTSRNKLVYEIETKKENRKYKFQVLEHYNGNTQIVSRFDFKDQAKEFAEFHNKNQVWLVNGGIPKHLCII